MSEGEPWALCPQVGELGFLKRLTEDKGGKGRGERREREGGLEMPTDMLSPHPSIPSSFKAPYK